MKDSTLRKSLTVLGFIALALAASIATRASLRASGSPSASAHETLMARGRYLVENVAMCADCHSPRDEKGEFVRDRWLGGTPLAFQPTVPMPWSPAAPAIAGLPSMTELQALAFLQSGQRADGTKARPPMPEYRLNPEDARAVVAYLKSLPK